MSLWQPFRCAGYYYDPETNLYYLKSRYYSPDLGRFLTRDDIDNIDCKNPQTLNGYTYAGNNPVNNTDPNGDFALAAALPVLAVPGVGEAAAVILVGAVAIGATAYLGYTIYNAYKSKPVNLPSWKKVSIDTGHIIPRHGSGGNIGGPGKSRFPDWMTPTAIAEAIRQAYRYGEVLSRQAEQSTVYMRGPWGNSYINMYVNYAKNIITTAWPSAK